MQPAAKWSVPSALSTVFFSSFLMVAIPRFALADVTDALDPNTKPAPRCDSGKTPSTTNNIRSTTSNSTSSQNHSTTSVSTVPARNFPDGDVIVHCGEQWNGNNQADVRAYNLAPDSRASSSGKDDSESSAWKTVERFVPVLQSLLWMLFASYVIYMFRSALSGLVNSVGKRIDDGAEIHTPWGSLSGGLGAQTSAEQRSRLEEKMREAGRDGQPPFNAPAVPGVRQTAAGDSAKFLRAEDLAIRALQTEYAVAIARNVKTGRGFAMDGFFELGNRPYIVEIKLVTEALEPQRIAESVQRVLAAAQVQGWTNARVILALVLETKRETDKLQMIKLTLSRYEDIVQVKSFSLRELEERFQGDA